MISLLEFLLVIALIVLVSVAALRALILFELKVKNGKVIRAYGRLPQALLNDLLVVCPRGQDSTITIVCRAEQGRARLITKGPLDEGTIQRMRNLLGLWPLARLKASPRVRA